MSIETIMPGPVSDAAEERRRIASDFQEVFGTTSGERVLSYILNEICQANKVLRTVDPNHIEMSSHNALYFGALKDAAVEIRHLLNIEFRDDPKPVVRHNKFSSRPKGVL